MSTKQINYYKLDKLEAESFQDLLKDSVARVHHAVDGGSKGPEDRIALDELAVVIFSDETLSKFLLLLARLPVFSKDFERLFENNLDGLQCMKRLKFFVNLKIRETLYLLVKLSDAFGEKQGFSSMVDVTKFFSVDQPSPTVERLVDLKFHGAIMRAVLFSEGHPKRAEYMEAFENLEKIEPHAVYPTSIYRQSDGCTVATNDSQKIEAVMSTTLTTSIRISSHVLGFDNPLLAEIYRPIGRVVVVMDDKLCDLNYTNGDVEIATNRRAVLTMDPTSDPQDYTKLSIAEQLNRYFAYHNVEVKVLSRSGDEVDKDIENVQGTNYAHISIFLDYVFLLLS
jgi:hypothetical protein